MDYKDKNLAEIFSEGLAKEGTILRAYEAESDTPVFYDHDGKWFENIDHNKVIVKENFHKLYLIPNVKPHVETEPEPTINFTLTQINRKGIWEQFCDWKGWDIYAAAERCDWNEKVEIPLTKAKKWGLI